jgi:hypothetical protein
VTPPDARLFYSAALLDITGSRGVRLPSPLVRGTIGGRATMMIVDTGAHVPVVASWLAEEAGLVTTGSIQGRASAGMAVQMRRTDHPAWFIDGWGDLVDRPTAIADLPDTFRRAGIGAIVSPQALATTSAVVVLDLTADRMRLVPRAGWPSAEFRSMDLFALPGARLGTYDSNGLRARSLVAAITIEGTELAVDLDTGTNGITLGRATEVGRALAAKSKGDRTKGLGAAGEFDATRIDDVSVRFGELETKTSVNLVVGAANASLRTAGLLGMDYLRTCVLVIGQDDLQVSCRLPPITSGKPACDACMQSRCRDPAAICQRAPARCDQLATCASRCTSRSCFDDCASSSPEGVSLNRCLSESCADSCDR